jgi:phospholipid/cholesterol/gamma-HCH transport system permease protein
MPENEAATHRFFREVGEMVRLFLRTVYWFKAIWWNMGKIANELIVVGIQSVFVVSIMALFTGMVVALQTGFYLNQLQVKALIGGIVGLSILKEMAPVQTSLLVAARVGAGMTAEIGTMNVSEEVDALRSLAIDPVRYLVMPRFIACIIMLPLLTVFANSIGIIGGMVVAKYQLGVSMATFMERMTDYIKPWDFVSGLIKSFIFGLIISIVGCYNGLQTQGGAEGLGKATTKTVVVCFMSILISNYFISKVFGWWS